MATPIAFTAVLDWVDATDPNNIPANVRIITASDLMRYERFGLDATAKINTIEAAQENHADTIAGHTTSIGTINTWKTSATTDLTDLKKKLQLTATKTTAYTVAQTDAVIIGNGTSITITLPSAVTSANGKVFVIKNKHTTSLTVASAAGTIDGAATKALAQWASLTVVSDGANWFAI